jgi:hypothetical protein
VDDVPNRSALVNVTSAILPGAMPCADSRIICARRQVTTDPVPLRTIRSSRCPSSSSISRTCTRSAMPDSLTLQRRQRTDTARRATDYRANVD